MRAVLATATLALLLAACGGDGDSAPSSDDDEEEFVTWSGPTDQVLASYATDDELCPTTSFLSRRWDVPTKIVYENERVYWLSQLLNWSPGVVQSESPYDSGYRLESLALYPSGGFVRDASLVVYDVARPGHSYAYGIYACH